MLYVIVVSNTVGRSSRSSLLLHSHDAVSQCIDQLQRLIHVEAEEVDNLHVEVDVEMDVGVEDVSIVNDEAIAQALAEIDMAGEDQVHAKDDPPKPQHRTNYRQVRRNMTSRSEIWCHDGRYIPYHLAWYDTISFFFSSRYFVRAVVCCGCSCQSLVVCRSFHCIPCDADVGGRMEIVDVMRRIPDRRGRND